MSILSSDMMVVSNGIIVFKSIELLLSNQKADQLLSKNLGRKGSCKLTTYRRHKISPLFSLSLYHSQLSSPHPSHSHHRAQYYHAVSQKQSLQQRKAHPYERGTNNNISRKVILQCQSKSIKISNQVIQNQSNCQIKSNQIIYYRTETIAFKVYPIEPSWNLDALFRPRHYRRNES